jgi:hypothetical protein
MIKRLAELCAGAVFVLVLCGSVIPLWAHDDCGPGGKGKHSEGHPHCNPDTGSTDDGSLYDVWVSGDLVLGQFTGHDPVGKDEAVVVSFQYLNMDLTILYDAVTDGNACFFYAPVQGLETTLSIGHDKDKALVATYFFSGFGADGTSNVRYRLRLSSTENLVPFPPGWRPTTMEDEPFSVEFNEWEVGGKKAIACNGSGSLNTTIWIRKKN